MTVTILWSLLISVSLGTLISFFYYDFFRTIRIQSISANQLNVLKVSQHDANTFIKEFYDFKHKNISTCLKGTASVFAICTATLLKISFEDSAFSHLATSHYLLIGIVVLLIIVNIFLVS